MLKKVQKKIEELHMISSKEKVLVGVSGGADSVCLLLVLSLLSKEMDFSLKAVHVEHGIRGEESRRDQVFVEELCQRLKVHLYSFSVDVPAYCSCTGLGTEEAARILRYQVFEQLALEQKAKVALAHHMEDNAETILFQLARGSALTGLGGMKPVRQTENGVAYIRPLLFFHRQEIEDFLETQDMEFRTDSTNEQLDYSRNYIRGVILPELMKVNPQAVSHINSAAEQLREVRDFLEQEADYAWTQVVSTDGRADGKPKLILDIKKLMILHTALQKEIAYRAIAHMLGSRKDISLVHVVNMLELCENQSGKELHLPNGLIAQKEYESLLLFYRDNRDIFLEKGKDNNISISSDTLASWKNEGQPVEIPLSETGERLEISIFPYEGKTVEISQKIYTKWFDYDKIKDGFCIRTRCSGDAFIGDSSGHRKKLKQYFIDEKVPVSLRDKMWLLAQADIVLWLIGGRMSEHVKVTKDTNTIIEITYYGGK